MPPSAVALSARHLQLLFIGAIALLTVVVERNTVPWHELTGREEHGLITISTIPTQRKLTCNGFFTVLANTWVPFESSCTSVYEKFDELLKEHSDHMVRMNQKLVVFTSWNETQLQEPGCNLDGYPGLETVQFDPEELLLKSGYKQRHIDWMKQWAQAPGINPYALVARLSDIFRISLAAEHSLAYADLDMVYLLTDPTVYLAEPNVASPVWSEERGAFEIQNSGFCFSKPQLDYMQQYMQSIVESKGENQTVKDSYFYTELGPNTFQHVIHGFGPIQIFNTICDNTWEVSDITRHCKAYEMIWLHLDKAIRRRNKFKRGLPYSKLVSTVRETCGLETAFTA